MVAFTSPYPSVSVPNNSFFRVLQDRDAFSGGTLAYVDGVSGERVTRDSVWQQSLTLARGLQGAAKAGLLPLTKGSTVLVVSPNSILYPTVMLALSAAGICGAFASPQYVAHELANAFTSSGSSHVLTHPALLPVVIAALASLGFSRADAEKKVIILAKKEEMGSLAEGSWVGYEDLVMTASVTAAPAVPEDLDEASTRQAAVIFFSSGTTGKSKAVALSHYNVNAILAQLDSVWTHYRQDDVVLGVIPFSHVFGGIIALLFSFFKGVPVVSFPRFEAPVFLASIAKFRITTALLVPPIVNLLARHPVVDSFDVTSLRYIVVGAAPIPPATIQLCMERFRRRGVDLKVCQAYGMSETSACLNLLPVERVDDACGSVGPLLPNAEGRVVDENGNDVDVGAPGELWAKGPNIMMGYANNAAATAETFTSDGWLKTGDVVTRDSEGFLTVVDRSKELIKYKGFQVPPAEVETLLTSHPLIADAGVIGVYSESESTELPKAFIVPKDTATLNEPAAGTFKDDILTWMKGRVAPHKLLRGGIELVEAIPRNAAGKILRRDLRDREKGTAKL